MLKILILSTIFLLCTAFKSTNIDNYTRINGVQIFVLNTLNYKDTALFFNVLKQKNINTILIRVFHNQGDRPHMGAVSDCKTGVYFKTDVACMISDLLADIIPIAKENDIKVYAWMATRSLSFLKDGDNLSQSFSPDGRLVGGYGANIFKSNVRQDILQLFSDLAKYDIDGILFQDDFIIKYSEGADNLAKELFFKDSKIKADPKTFFTGVKQVNAKPTFTGFRDEFYIWARWKNKELMKLFAEIRDTVKSSNHDIMLAANVYYETPIQPKNALAWYSQDLDALKAAGADYIAVMGYSEQIADELKLNEIQTANIIKDIALRATESMQSNTRVIMKLQTRSFKADKRLLRKSEYYRVLRRLAAIDNLSIVVVPVSSENDIY